MSKSADDESKKGKKIVSQLTRSVQLVFMLIVVSLIASGPGFHLRQNWIGFKQKDKMLVECAIDANIPYSDKSRTEAATNECLLKNNPDLAVTSLRGHYGNAGTAVWADLTILPGQAFCLSMTIILLLFVCVLLGFPCLGKDVPFPRMVILAGLAFGVLVMFITTALQFWYYKCGGYISGELEKFKKDMEAYDKRNPLVGEYLNEKNRIVVCYVQGYAVAGFFSILCTLIFGFDFLFIYQMERGGPSKSVSAAPSSDPPETQPPPT